MFCEKCGNKLEDTWKSCPYCGQPTWNEDGNAPRTNLPEAEIKPGHTASTDSLNTEMQPGHTASTDSPHTEMQPGHTASTDLPHTEMQPGHTASTDSPHAGNGATNTSGRALLPSGVSASPQKKSNTTRNLLIGLALLLIGLVVLCTIGMFFLLNRKVPSQEVDTQEEIDTDEQELADSSAEDAADQDNSMTVEEYLDYCILVTGEELARNPEDYVGKNILIEGDFNILAGEIVLDWFTDTGILKIQCDGKAVDQQGNVVGNIVSGDHGIVAGQYGGENTWGQRYIDAEVIILTNSGNEVSPENPEQPEENVTDTDSVGTEDAVEDDTASLDSLEYIFPDSDSRYLSEEELLELNADGLRIARNEIFARHGYIFKDAALREYFGNTSWYHGTIPANQFQADSVFNDFEKANIDLINSIEAQAP